MNLLKLKLVLFALLLLVQHCVSELEEEEEEEDDEKEEVKEANEVKETNIQIGKSNFLFRLNENTVGIENHFNGKLLNFSFDDKIKRIPQLSIVTINNNNTIKTNITAELHPNNEQVDDFRLSWDAKVELCWQCDNATWFNSIVGRRTNDKLSAVFFNSNGFALAFEDSSQIRWNGAKLCVKPLLDQQPDQDIWNLMKVLVSRNIKTAYDKCIEYYRFTALQNVYPNMTDYDLREDPYNNVIVFENPIFVRPINNDTDFLLHDATVSLVEFVKQNYFKHDNRKILIHFETSNRQLYDNDFTFDRSNPDEMFNKLHRSQSSARIIFPVSPFIKKTSPDFEKLQFLMFKNKTTNQTVYDEDAGGQFDLSNNKVQNWLNKKLNKACRKYGLDYLLLETGKFGSYDANSLFQSPIANLSTKINIFYVGNCSSLTLYNYIPFVQIDQSVNSNFEKNLQSLIPIALSVGLSKQMKHIGANLVSENDKQTNKPSEELYVRWVQAAALMPIMKLSIPPWSYSKQIDDIVKKVIELRSQFVPIIVQLAKDGELIIQPMWLVFPDDPECSTIKDQFMLGKEVLVAPVTVVGQRERSAYLPKGLWIDQHDKAYTGPGVFSVKAPLEELPYFTLFQRM